MNPLIALLKDRKRSQRGSVLSGVLIITAFISIIAGALMTELSTNFIVSNDLMNRAANEAAVSSAVELSLSQIQGTQLYSSCPNLNPVTLNNRTAVATYGSCWPTIDAHWSGPEFQTIASSASPFNVDAAHVQLSGRNEYLVGNSGGILSDYQFGSTTAQWTLPLNVTGPPLVMVNPMGSPFADVIPASGSYCSPNPYCIDVRNDYNNGSQPTKHCTIGTNGPMVSQPGASRYRPGYAFYWDGTYLQVTDVSGFDCDSIARTLMPSSQPIVAGPLVLCASSCAGGDNVYMAISDNNPGQLVWFTYNGGFTQRQAVPLPWGNVTGIAASASSLPATLAISFKSGGIAVVSIASNGVLGSPVKAAISGGVADAPSWCTTACGNLIGVGGQNAFYLYDATLSPVASFATGSPITTSPGADGSGFWYVGTNDGIIRELQYKPGPGLTQLRQYAGPVTQFGSSPQIGPCPTGICIYSAGVNGTASLLILDARDAVLWACLSASPPACSGTNPRLWAQVEIGVQGNTKAVHVQGWSYYSP